MSSNIAVSVICNVYNHGPYLRDALQGFVTQKTDFAFEVLIHDDASTDDSAEIIREYEANHPDIIKPIYQKENQYSKKIPIYKTYQIPRIQGKYVALCEGDDYWTDPLKLQKQFDFMEKNPEYSLCACSTIWKNLRTGVTERKTIITEDRDVSVEELLLAKNGSFFQFASLFMKTEIFSCYPVWRSKFPIGDYPLSILAALNGKVHVLSDVMTVYRYYAANSWTERMDNDDSLRARTCLRMIEGLESLDASTEGKYHALVSKRIQQHRYTYALMTHDYTMLKSEELKELFYSRNLLLRLSDVVRCKYPVFYKKMIMPVTKLIKSVYGK